MDQNSMDEETKLWLEEKLIPNLEIALNQQDSLVKYEVLPTSVPLFSSSLIFLDIDFEKNDQKENFSLVVKMPPRSESIRTMIQSEKLFHNEILFYTKYAQNGDYPRCFYTLEDPPTNSVIVIENISQYGYSACPQMVNLDMKYILAVMEEIGKFHAKGYIMKKESPEEFFQIVDDIQESKYKREKSEKVPIFMNNLVSRVIKRLRERNYDEVFCDKAEKFFSNAYENIMQAAFNPEIPLATLCHGNITLNNIFFKESDSNVKTMLFDFAMMNYGSPAIDLSTFIFLSVSRDNLNTRFTEIFDAYYDSVVDQLQKAGWEDLEEFSRENFLKDYKRHALFGYIVANYHLPKMYGTKYPDSSSTPSERKSFWSDIGGDKFAEIFTEMLLDMRESGCLDHVLSA